MENVVTANNVTAGTVFSLRRLLKGASIYSIGDMLVKASGFFLIPLYTRYLSPADYGVVGYLQIFLQIATVLLGFQFYGAQTRFYYENINDYVAQGRFSFTINITSVVIGLVIVLPLTFFSYRADWYIGYSRIPFWPLFIITLWTVIFQTMAQNATNYYRTRQMFCTAALLLFLQFLAVSVPSVIFVTVYSWGAFGRIFGLMVGTCIFLIITYWIYARHFVLAYSWKALKYAVFFGGPLVLHNLAGVIHNVIDRVMLEKYVSLDELGIYTLAFTIGAALNIFIMAFNQAYQPTYFQLMSSDSKSKSFHILRTFRAWLTIILVISLSGIVFGPPFIKIFAGTRFHASVKIFPYIILAFFMGSFYYFFSSPIFFFKKTKWLPIMTAISALVNIILNCILIPSMGIKGAAVSTAISHACSSAIALIVGNRLYPIRWPYAMIVLSCIVVIGCMFIGGTKW